MIGRDDSNEVGISSRFKDFGGAAEGGRDCLSRPGRDSVDVGLYVVD
jgi:hypothetical protein